MVMEIEHTEISEKVYQIMKKMILNRDFAGGQKLELNLLANQMRISRTPLKDAVNRLVTEGLLEVKPRSGTFVSEITCDDIRHIMEMRMMIELWCLSRLDKGTVQHLSQQLNQIVQQAGQLLQSQEYNYEQFLELDVEFHQAIVRSSKNPKMMDMYLSLNSFLKISRIFYFKSYDHSQKGQKEHEEIAACVASFQIDQAKSMMEKHIENSKERMITLLEENGGAI